MAELRCQFRDFARQLQKQQSRVNELSYQLKTLQATQFEFKKDGVASLGKFDRTVRHGRRELWKIVCDLMALDKKCVTPLKQ